MPNPSLLAVRDFTRGGQTLLHFCRMAYQVAARFTVGLFVIWLIVSALFYVATTTQYDRYLAFKWATSKTLVDLGDVEGKTDLRLQSGRKVSLSMTAVAQDRRLHAAFQRQVHQIKAGMIVGLFGVLGVFALVCMFVMRTGKGLRQEKRLRGGQLVSHARLSQELRRRREASDITIASVPLLKNGETSHTLITGSPGTGKSLAIRELLDSIERRGDRAIVYSGSTEFITDYYTEGRDVILNPLDQRCPVWNIWADCQTPTEFDQISGALIPDAHSGRDPFWNKAAQTLFSAVAQQLADRENRSTKELLDILLNSDLEGLAKEVQGTEAYSLVEPKAEKTALSVKANMAAYARSLKFLPNDAEVDQDKIFSLRKWLRDDSATGWLFMSSRADQKQSLRPLLSMWLDTIAATILSLDDKPDRRIWIIIDELPSLNRLPSLNELLAQGRKYGACGVLGFQSYAQLCDIYGKNGANEITGLCSTWLMYRSNEPETMEWCSKALGNKESEETREGISYGANEIRDGVSLNTSRQMRPLVLSSEFKALPNRTGYLRLPGDYPVARITVPYVPREGRAQGTIPMNPKHTCWS